MKALFLLTLLCYFGVNALSASHNDFLIERIKHTELVPRHISGIAVDQTGYLWLATSDGLYRHDGKRYRVFKSESRNPSSLPNNNLRDVIIDTNGTIWVLSQGGGLSEYRPETKDFENHKPVGDFPSSVTGTFDFWSIQQIDDTLLLSSFGGDGYFVFDLITRNFKRVEVPLTSTRHFTQTTVIHQSTNQFTWIGTDESGLLRMDSSGKLIQRYNTANGLLRSDRVREIFEDTAGSIWVGTLGAGLYKISGESGEVLSTPYLDKIEGLSTGSVYTIYQDNERYVWIGSSVGLLIFNTQTNEIGQHYQHDPSSSFSLSNNDIRSIYRDSSGIYWIGTRNGGLNKLTQSQHFVNILPQHYGGVLKSGAVRAITIHNDKLWIGTEGGGITILNLDEYSVFDTILPSSAVYSGLNSDEITFLLPDPDGGIWVGTWGGGLHYLAHGSRSFISYRHNPADETSMSDDRIQFINLDSQGRYWVGTENGLNLFDRETSTFTRFISNPEDSSSLSSNSLQSLGFIEYSPNLFWVASWHGLNLFDSSDKTVKRFNSNPEKINSISADQVISLYLDDDVLWIGTFGGGLNKLDIKTGAIQNITEAEGLPNNVVFAILPDDDGNLWLSSSKGLTRFNPESFSFINYTDTDGIQGNDFWWGSAYKDQHGKLYFGGTSGLTILDPAQIRINEFNAPVVISSIYIDGYPVSVPSRNQQLLIQPEQNTITLEFAALDFQSPEKNQYAYMLDGLHREWTYAGGRSQVNFASLPPGTYTFRVRGTNSDGVWSTEIASLNIYVVPRFYQTAWFYFLATMSLAIGIILGVRYWTRYTRLRQIELEELVAERTQILEQKKDELLQSYADLRGQTIKLTEKNVEVAKQNAVILAKSKELESINKQLITLNEEKNSLIGIVAHDLRSPAASIMSCVQLLQLQPELERAEQEELFDTIRQFVEKQLFMVTRILDSQSLESGSLVVNRTTVNVESLLKSTQNNLMEKARAKCISIKLRIAEQLCPFQTDLDILDQILDNLISNAIKFSPRDTIITLVAEQTDNKMKIGVIDQGPGLTEADKVKLFGKYQRLSARPTDGEQSTGLGLSIVKRLTQVLGGEVWCESTYGEGAAFWISLPLNSDSLTRRKVTI